jgi:hypothetical protein
MSRLLRCYSAAGRRRIAAAQRERWAKTKAQQKKAGLGVPPRLDSDSVSGTTDQGFEVAGGACLTGLGSSLGTDCGGGVFWKAKTHSPESAR